MVYIGKTNNPNRRFGEHIRSKSEYEIHKAIRQFGSHCFEFDIIGEYETEDECFSNEETFIKIFDCVHPNGYNMTPGGKLPPSSKGKTICDEIINSRYKIDVAEHDYIISLYNGMSYAEIARLYDVDPKTIKRIVNKKSSKSEFTKNFGMMKLSEEDVDKILELAKKETYTSIAKQFGVSRSTISRLVKIREVD